MVLKFLKNLRECSEFFGKLRKQFKSVFQMILRFFKIFANLRKCSKIFRKLRKQFKSVFKFFFWFLKRCSKIIGKFPDVIGNVRNGSQELKSFGAGF